MYNGLVNIAKYLNTPGDTVSGGFWSGVPYDYVFQSVTISKDMLRVYVT